jgi:MFS family permease
LKGDRSAGNGILHYAWIILALCFINLFINYGIRVGYTIVLPEMIRTMGLTRTEGGNIFNAYLLTYLCLSPFTGYLTDRFGARTVVSVFGILLGCGTVLMGNITNVREGVICFALAGIGGAAMWTPILTVTQRWFAPKRRGMALGILSTGFGLGPALMGRLYPVIANHWSWRYGWYFLGISALLMVVMNTFFLRSRPEDKRLLPWGEAAEAVDIPRNAEILPVPKARYAAMFTASRFWLIGASYFMIAASLYITLTFIVDYARSNLGFSYDRASLLATVHGIGQAAGVLTIPVLSDYVGRRRTIIFSNMMVAAGTAGVILSGGHVTWLFVSIGILGAFHGATFPMYGACGGDYFRKEVIGSVIGAWTPFYGIGAILAIRMAGQIRDATGSFVVPFQFSILTALVAAILMFFVKKSPAPESVQG